MPQPDDLEPETRDWTFVIDAGCEQCGFDPAGVQVGGVGERLRATIPRWTAALRRPDAADRPSPQVWSPIEYGCHVRDTCRIFRGRLVLMQTRDDPEFANWDQDVSAVEDAYWSQDPQAVAEQYAREATATAAVFDTVTPDQHARPGRRSNGSAFTIASFAVYFLHDIEHHLHDVAA